MKATIKLKKDHSVNTTLCEVKAVKESMGWRIDAPMAIWIDRGDIESITPITEEEELIDECDEIRKQGEGVGLSDVLVEVVKYAYHKGKQSA